MSTALENAAEILKAKLPELNVRIIEPRTLGAGTFDIKVEPKIAVELPEANANLRLGLLHELSERTGISFSSDSRALDGACIGGSRPEDILQAVRTAANNGKLDGLTVEYLEQTTGDGDKQAALRIRQQGGRIAQTYLDMATPPTGGRQGRY